MPDGDQELAQVFSRAQLALREQGWCQGEYAILYVGDEQPHLCLDAALLRGIGMNVAPTLRIMGIPNASGHNVAGADVKRPVVGPNPEKARYRCLHPNKRKLLIKAFQVLYGLLKEDHYAPNLTDYNDAPDRQLIDILEMLKRAEHLASSRENPPSISKIYSQPSRLTSDQRILLVADYKSGVPIVELSVKYGIASGTAYKILRQEKIPLRRKNSKTVQQTSPQRDAMRDRKTFFNDEQAYILRAEYENGATVWQLAAQYGYGSRTIRKTILYAGGQLRPPGGVRKPIR